MSKYLLAAGLATIAFPTVAFAAPQEPPMSHDQHQKMSGKNGCCPAKKDSEKPDDCCKGMKCCDAMKSAKSKAADAHGWHDATH